MAFGHLSDEALVEAAATAPITSGQAQAAKRELVRMRASLTKWLEYRAINDKIASGLVLPAPLLKRPGARPPSAAVMALRLRKQRSMDEEDLALQLHQLLSECFDGASLPSPDIAKNPNVAVELAQLVIAGKLPGETAPSAAGFVWLWPVVIVVGAIAMVVMSAIRSSADLAKEREHLECIKSGACTDYGFWLKVGAVVAASWIIWEKFGLGAYVQRTLKKGRS
jgi:hypothetical protein